MTDLEASRQLRRLDEAIDRARTVLDLWNANVQAHRLSVGTNFALISAASAAAGLRRRLGLGSSVHSVTQGMMDEYAEIAARSALVDRLRGLDDWLKRHGHRGPHETDPAQPRFAEQREILIQDLSRARTNADHPRSQECARVSPQVSLARLLCRWEKRREWFRDELMRYTQRLRRRILDEAGEAVAAGQLDDPDDIFWLDRSDLAADPSTWRMRIKAKRARWRCSRLLDLPTTASRDALEATAGGSSTESAESGENRFEGIGLGSDDVTGVVVKAQLIDELLHKRDWPDSAVLVVDALEPSWAVVYSRFTAVVSELGGELSHAAILLREAGVPSVINAPGVFHGLVEGELVRVDPCRGEVVRLTEQPDDPEPELELELEARPSEESVRQTPAAGTATSRPSFHGAGAGG
jgi:phosphohistidine swiveling domain-containing protein